MAIKSFKEREHELATINAKLASGAITVEEEYKLRSQLEALMEMHDVDSKMKDMSGMRAKLSDADRSLGVKPIIVKREKGSSSWYPVDGSLGGVFPIDVIDVPRTHPSRWGVSLLNRAGDFARVRDVKKMPQSTKADQQDVVQLLIPFKYDQKDRR